MNCSRSVLLDRPALPAAPLPTAVTHLLPRHFAEATVPEVMDRLLDPSARGLDLAVGGRGHLGDNEEVRLRKVRG